VLQRWGEMRDLRMAAVYGRNGEPLAVLRRPAAGDSALPEVAPLPRERHVGLDSLRLARQIEGRKGFSGILYVEVAFGTLYRYLFILLGSLAVLTLLAIVAMRAALAKAGEWLARPIADLASLAGELSGRPELEKRASLTGPREIADLAQTFNDM
jgi:methyl-accepting chemotaxis protein